MSTPCPHALNYQLKDIFLERNKASFSNSENFRKFVNPEINEINSPLDLDEKWPLKVQRTVHGLSTAGAAAN